MKTQYQYFYNSTNTKEKNFFYEHTLRYNTIQPYPLLHLTPDYFLSSSNNSYLGKKYHKLQQRISRIVSASLLSAMVLTATLDAKAQSAIEPNQSFLFGKGSAGISTGGIGGGGI